MRTTAWPHLTLAGLVLLALPTVVGATVTTTPTPAQVAKSRVVRGEILAVDRAAHSFRLREKSGTTTLPPAGVTREIVVTWRETTRFVVPVSATPAETKPRGAATSVKGEARSYLGDAAIEDGSLRPGVLVTVRGRNRGPNSVAAGEVTFEGEVARAPMTAAPAPAATAAQLAPVPPATLSGRTMRFALVAGLAALVALLFAFRRRGRLASGARVIAPGVSVATAAGQPRDPDLEEVLAREEVAAVPPGTEVLAAGLRRLRDDARSDAPAQPGEITLLLVDDEPDIRLVVEAVLRSHGYKVVTAATGVEALECVAAWTPDAIVTDVMMPEMDGFAFVRRLRATPRFALVPVIFLTMLSQAESRIRGFRLGADDYLVKSQFTELPARIEAALGRRSRLEGVLEARPAARPRGFSGSLEELGLATVLSSLEQEQKTGVLTLRSTGGEEAMVQLRAGKVVSAGMTGRPSPRNADVIYAVLDWAGGDFEFAPGSVEGDDEVCLSVMHILMEGARLQDEREHDRSAAR